MEALAAIITGRHFVGFDTDPDYVALGNRRIGDLQRELGVQQLAL